MEFIYKSYIKGIGLALLVVSTGLVIGLTLNEPVSNDPEVPTEEQLYLDPFQWVNQSSQLYPFLISAYVGPNISLPKFFDNIYYFDLYFSGNASWKVLGESIDGQIDGASLVREQQLDYNESSMTTYGTDLRSAVANLSTYDEVLPHLDRHREDDPNPYGDRLQIYETRHNGNSISLYIYNSDSTVFRFDIFPDAIFVGASMMYYNNGSEYRLIDENWIIPLYQQDQNNWNEHYGRPSAYSEPIEFFSNTHYNFARYYFIDLVDNQYGMSSPIVQFINGLLQSGQ